MSEVWSAGLSTLFEPSRDELVERVRPKDQGGRTAGDYLLVLGRRR